jgi:hypothetical protein
MFLEAETMPVLASLFCGIARLSPRSIVATGVFMATAIIVVALTHHVFGG